MDHDDADARAVLDWMKENGRWQDWRALDAAGRPKVYRRKVCEISRTKVRVSLNIPGSRLDAALAYLCSERLVNPIGRTLPISSCQAVELWMVNP
jgi:hypothetical protein